MSTSFNPKVVYANQLDSVANLDPNLKVLIVYDNTFQVTTISEISNFIGTAAVSLSETAGNILVANNDGLYAPEFVETEPAYTSSTAATISNKNIQDWNSKLTPSINPAYFFETYNYTKSSEVFNVAGIKDLSITINGTSGSTSFTASGPNLATFSGAPFPCVIFDGTSYTSYYCYGISGGNGTLSTPLSSTVTNGTLKTIHDSFNGQHLTDYGYRSLADGLINTLTYSALKNNAVLFQPELNPSSNPFSLTSGTLNAAGFVPGTTDLPNFCSVQANTQGASQLGSHIFLIQQGGAGRGITWTVNLGNKSGYFEAYIGLLKKNYNSAASTTAGSTVVTLTIDGTIVYTRTIIEFNGQNIIVPFTNATTAILTVTTGDSTPTSVAVNRIGFYITTNSITDKIFSPTDKVVFLGDSWTQYQNTNQQDWSTRFKTKFQEIGGDPTKIINVGRSGMTSVWGKYWFDTIVLPNHPTVCIIEFFTNDNNSIPFVGVGSNTSWNFSSTSPYDTNTDVDGKLTAGQWLANINWMIQRCIDNNIQPVIAMPAHTASISQTQLCFDNLLSLLGSNQYYDVKSLFSSNVQAISVTAPVVVSSTSVTTPAIITQKITGGSATTGGYPIIETLETNSAAAKGIVARPANFIKYTGSAGHLFTVQNGDGTSTYTDAFWIDNAGGIHGAQLYLSAGIRAAALIKNSVITLDESNFSVFFNIGTATNAPLPAAAAFAGKIYCVKNINTGGFAVTIIPNGSETIDGNPNYVLASKNDSVIFQSDGANWQVLAERKTAIATTPIINIVHDGDISTLQVKATTYIGPDVTVQKTFLLPTSAAFNDKITIYDPVGFGYIITQNANQKIKILAQSTTIGIDGSLTLGGSDYCFKADFTCISNDGNTWLVDMVSSSFGNYIVV